MSVKLLRCLKTDFEEAKQQLQNQIYFHKSFLNIVKRTLTEDEARHAQEARRLKQTEKYLSDQVMVWHSEDSTTFKPSWEGSKIEEIKVPYDAAYNKTIYTLEELLKIGAK